MSKTFLFIDTETTGFPKKGNLIQDGQARVCQIAMLLTDETGKHLTEFSALIKPDGWKISEGASQVHGFTDEFCELYGITTNEVIYTYFILAEKASLIIAHNADFDKGMMEIEAEYFQNEVVEEGRTKINTPWHCTMKTNTHITGGKWPKLEEAYKHYTGKSLGDNAHDAMYDVKACRDIFFATPTAALLEAMKGQT